jgi:hypothetical protein
MAAHCVQVGLTGFSNWERNGLSVEDEDDEWMNQPVVVISIWLRWVINKNARSASQTTIHSVMYNATAKGNISIVCAVTLRLVKDRRRILVPEQTDQIYYATLSGPIWPNPTQMPKKPYHERATSR